MIHFLLLALLVFAESPAAADDVVFFHAKGAMNVKCRTSWHQFDITVTADESARLSDPGLHRFRPVSLKAGHTWHLEGKDLTELAKALHAIKWQADDRDAETYSRWLGSMKQEQSLTAGGKLTLKLSKGESGLHAEIAGTLQVEDSGRLGNRFGPNGWRKTWKHKISGTVRLNETGQVTAVELTDKFEVSGGFTNVPGAISDPAAQQGSLVIRLVVPKPLSAAEAQKVEKLVVQLGSDQFILRQKASTELRKMGPRIAPLLRELVQGNDDAEVRARIGAILKQFP